MPSFGVVEDSLCTEAARCTLHSNLAVMEQSLPIRFHWLPCIATQALNQNIPFPPCCDACSVPKNQFVSPCTIQNTRSTSSASAEFRCCQLLPSRSRKTETTREAPRYWTVLSGFKPTKSTRSVFLSSFVCHTLKLYFIASMGTGIGTQDYLLIKYADSSHGVASVK